MEEKEEGEEEREEEGKEEGKERGTGKDQQEFTESEMHSVLTTWKSWIELNHGF